MRGFLCRPFRRRFEPDLRSFEKLARLAYDRDAAIIALPVHAHDNDWPGRRRQQQVREILLENANGFPIRPFLQLSPDLRLNQRAQNAIVAFAGRSSRMGAKTESLSLMIDFRR